MAGTSAKTSSTVEIANITPRRRWSVGEKVRLIEASMAPGQSVSLVARESGLPFPVICKRMSWSKSYGRRVFRNEKFYPSFADLPRWCAVVGNTIVLQWALARATTHGLEAQFDCVDCQSLLLRITGMFADAGTVAARAREAVADNLLQQHELRAVVNGLDSLIEGTLGLLGDLRHELKEARRGA